MSGFCCIYCKRQLPEVLPSDSHVIPTTLGGSLILRDAVCQKCNSLINKDIEEPFARDWTFLRSILGIESRRAKVPSVPAILTLGGNRIEVSLGKEGLPRWIPPLVTRRPEGGIREVEIFGPPEHVEKAQGHFLRKVPELKWTELNMENFPAPQWEIELPFGRASLPYSCRFATKVAFERLCLLRGTEAMLDQDYDPIRKFVLGEGDVLNSKVCQLMWHEQIMVHRFNVHFPLHSVLLFSDSRRVGAIVSFLGLFYYWVLLSPKYVLSSNWDDVIYIHPQRGEWEEPNLRPAFGKAYLPWADVIYPPEKEAEVIAKAGHYFILKLKEAVARGTWPGEEGANRQ